MKFSIQTTDKYDNKLGIIFFVWWFIAAGLSVLSNCIRILRTPSGFPDWLVELIKWLWLIIVVLFGITVVRRGRKIMRSKENHAK